MKESKLVKLLQKLDKAEIKRFGEFVNSPYYNKNKKNSQIFDSIVKFHPDFDPDKYSEEEIFKKTFKTKEYDYFAMKNILSDLHDLGLKFLMAEYKGERALSKELRMLEMLREKQAFDEYKKRLTKVSKKLETDKIESEFSLEDKLHLIYEEISYKSITDPNTHFDLKQKELDLTVNYFLVRILKGYCALLHELKQNNFPFNFTMIDDISNYLKSHSFEDMPIINMYKNVLFLQQTGDYKYYKILQDIRDKHFDELNHGDAYMLFVYVRSYTAVSYSEKMDKKYLKDCFELDKFMHSKGRITLGKILYPDFIATVKTAASVDEYEWAEMFMNEMKDELMDDVKDSTLNFSHGFIEYRKGNLDKAMELIYKSSFNIFIMQIQVYLMLLRIYYEIGHFEDAINLSKTAKGYLKKEIALGAMQNALKDFFNLTVEMVNLRLSVENKKDKSYKLDSIKKKTNDLKYNYFGIKNWLIDQQSKIKI